MTTMRIHPGVKRYFAPATVVELVDTRDSTVTGIVTAPETATLVLKGVAAAWLSYRIAS